MHVPCCKVHRNITGTFFRTYNENVFVMLQRNDTVSAQNYNTVSFAKRNCRNTGFSSKIKSYPV